MADMPTERTRVLFDATIKEGWRAKEIAIEIEGHGNPVARTSELFHALRRQAADDARTANNEINAQKGHLIRQNEH